jgi:hypothetical protein
MEQCLQTTGPGEARIVANGENATSLLFAHTSVKERLVGALNGIDGLCIGSFRFGLPGRRQRSQGCLLVTGALLSELTGHIVLLVISRTIPKAFLIPAQLIIGIVSPNDMFPPLSSNKQRSFNMPFEHYSSERAGVFMGSQIIEKFLVAGAELWTFSVKALPCIVNNVK